MRVNLIVLSEGKNDVHLVYSFFEEYDESYAVERFHGEEIQTELRAEESRKISLFREPRNQYHVLAKSENNKDNLQDVFVRLVNQLLGGRVFTPICMLVDLDGGNLKTFLDDIDERIRECHSGRGIELGNHSIVKRNRHLIACVCEVLTRQERVKGEFHVVAFRQTLERLTDIDRENDEREVKNEKVECLLDEDHVFDFLNSVLTQWE